MNPPNNKEKKSIFIVPDENDYYFDDNTNSIRRKDLLSYKSLVGDKKLTRKQIKKIQRDAKKQRIRKLKANGKRFND